MSMIGFTVIAIILIGLLGFMLKFALTGSTGKHQLKNFIYAVLCLITFCVILFETLKATGIVNDPIVQGTFKQEVEKIHEEFDLTKPVLKPRFPTDGERALELQNKYE